MTNNWIDEENARATELAKTGTTTNTNAPLLVKNTKKNCSCSSYQEYLYSGFV